jgi:hypothetical protein
MSWGSTGFTGGDANDSVTLEGKGTVVALLALELFDVLAWEEGLGDGEEGLGLLEGVGLGDSGDGEEVLGLLGDGEEGLGLLGDGDGDGDWDEGGGLPPAAAALPPHASTTWAEDMP